MLKSNVEFYTLFLVAMITRGVVVQSMLVIYLLILVYVFTVNIISCTVIRLNCCFFTPIREREFDFVIIIRWECAWASSIELKYLSVSANISETKHFKFFIFMGPISAFVAFSIFCDKFNEATNWLIAFNWLIEFYLLWIIDDRFVLNWAFFTSSFFVKNEQIVALIIDTI